MTGKERVTLETSEERLWIAHDPVQLSRNIFRLLMFLIEREGKLVTKRDILRNVWPDTNVSDASVKDSVKTLRATLGDKAASPVFIETVRGRGYRFLGGIAVIDRVSTGEPTADLTETLPSAPPNASLPPESPSMPAANATRRWPPLALGILAVVAVFVISMTWRPSSELTPARPDRIAFAIPEKPSIAVAPFVNVTGNADVNWLITGFSSSVITALSTSPDMVVISQNALDDMNGVRPGEIAERYGVRYVLDGTIQSEGGKLRITARLADALAGRTLWSDKWDRTLEDVFAIQDEIADAIFEELQVRLTMGEQVRTWRALAGTPENMRAAFLGRGAFQTFTPEGHEVAARHWNGMLERNPDLPMAMNLQGWLHWHKVIIGLSADPVADLLAAQTWAQKAIDGGLGGQPHVLYATAANYLGQSDKAIEYAEEGLKAAPGEADVVQIAGFVLAANGRLEEGISLMQRGMRLEPDYPDWLAGSMVNALVLVGRWADARDLADDMLGKNLQDDNAVFSALISLVVISVWQDDMAAARQYLGV